ncbi:MAG: formyltetrahydrofolate deformylase [Actinobacteria bacterium]|nr:formyltetrahydrofolate deformylase [Actinomycetota bacterium]NCY10604.1 formyltetrahydrofolate deformylase [Actinomycetota bacterium]NCZ71974.1 formyltetrahydrofolate deformylase [Actinomycetota bacterium]NDA35813.1 formyltetrahydrofolate deformylase [Actinomycetota bacterium]NDD07075.1 formyltetrahydrofolate deformylase [Actinomycetota bacterium]
MDLIATLQCADQRGIVHAMTSSVLACQGNIVENQQFTDPVTNSFVMRTRFETSASLDSAHKALSEGLAKFNPELTIRDNASPKRALVMVTKESHCLRDLLYLLELGELPIQIPLVVGNHQELQSLVESNGIKFRYLPVSSENKASAETQLLSIIDSEKIDFLVLARYMQILSPDFCDKLSNRIINIHHSFLPGFKGAKPYHQAHAKGVKIIGATAHFVTKDLDEGPIIEQDVAHVSHASTPEELIAIGRDIERRVLAIAVKLYAEDRIFIVGNRTVIFN